MIEFPLIIKIDAAELDGDISLHNAANFVASALDAHCQGTVPCEVTPLADILRPKE